MQKYNVFYFHGNAEVIGEDNNISEVLKEDCNFIQIEYPGYYTTSKPVPPFDSNHFMSEIEDTFIRINYSNMLPDLPIIFIGRSIGSVVAGALIKRLNSEMIDKLVLITPIAEISSNLFDGGDFRRLFFSVVKPIPEFDNIEMLKNTSFPVLLITVTNDEIVSNHNTNVLMRVRPGIKNIYSAGSHNDIRLSPLVVRNFIFNEV